ncbi:MAG: hypothetical protein ABL997_18145 [Planctomycetota bacterium]
MNDESQMPDRPPLGSWNRTYAAVCVCAVLVIVVLWWITAALDHGRIA